MVSEMRSWAVFVAVIVGCGSDGRSTPGSEGLLRYDAAMLEPPPDPARRDAGRDAGRGADAGGDAGGLVSDDCDDRPASDILGFTTPYSNGSYALRPFGFTLLSINFVVTVDSRPEPLFEVFAEIRNDSGRTQCTFIPDATFNGEEVIGLVDTARWDDSFGIHTDCIGAGEVGVWNGVARGPTQEDIEAAFFLDIDLMPRRDGVYFRRTGPVVASEEKIMRDGEYAVAVRLEVPASIYNYGYDAFVRDSRGVLIENLAGFPNDLGTLSPGTHTFETLNSTPCDFDGFLRFHSWLEGTSSGLVAGDSELDRLHDAQRRLRARAQAIRRE